MLSGDFGGKQSQRKAVFVSSPGAAIPPQQTGARALFTAEAAASVKQARREPFKTDRFPLSDMRSVHHAIDHPAARNHASYPPPQPHATLFRAILRSLTEWPPQDTDSDSAGLRTA